MSLTYSFTDTDHAYFTVCDIHMVATRTRSEKIFSNNKVSVCYYTYKFSNRSVLLPKRFFECKHSLPSVTVRTGAVFPQLLQSLCSFLYPLLIVLSFTQKFCSWWKMSFPADRKSLHLTISSWLQFKG